MQNHPYKKMSSAQDAQQPERPFFSGRSGFLILLCAIGTITALQFFIPAATLFAAPQLETIEDTRISLEPPRFGNQAPSNIAQESPQPASARYQIPPTATNTWGSIPQTSSNRIQIIPRRRSSSPGAYGIAHQQPLPFAPMDHRQASQLSPVSDPTITAPVRVSQPLPVPSRQDAAQALLNDQRPGRRNGGPFVLPNTMGRFAQRPQNRMETAPLAVQEVPLPASAAGGQGSGNASNSAAEFGSRQTETYNQNGKTWSMLPTPITPDTSGRGQLPSSNTYDANNTADKAKIPAGSWSVLPDKALLEANRAMEESFRRSMTPEGSEPAPPNRTEPNGSSNSLTPQPITSPNTGFGTQNSNTAVGSELPRPTPAPTQQPPQQNVGRPYSQNTTTPLTIPGVSDPLPSSMNSPPPDIFRQQPSHFESFPTTDNATPHNSNNVSPHVGPGFPNEPNPPIEASPALRPIFKQPVPAQGPPVYQQPPVHGEPIYQQQQQQPSYDAPAYQAQPTPIEFQPSVVLPHQQGGHSFPEMPAPDPVYSSVTAPNGYSGHGRSPGTSGYRATGESDAPTWMSPYQQRASVADSGSIISAVRNLPPLPPGFSPWWDQSVQQSTGPAGNSIPVDVGTLMQDALSHSPQVNAIKAEPEVQYRVITQEAAKFDWTAFLEATYDDLNDPVGNTLTTATGEDRLLTRKFSGSGGLRRKNLRGGEFRIAQDIGHENQTSSFFIPNNQGTSRLEISYRQPLLDGAGEAYNRSEIILASIAANASEDEVVKALQEHLIEVTEAYWALYRARAEFFQRQKLLTSARSVLTRLEGRSQVDTIPRQVLRSRAAVARAQTRIQRTLARVEDAESQLRLLVNSPAMLTGGSIEVLPLEAPNMVTENADLQSVLQTALANRPDISEAIRKMRASTVRLGVSKKELLPRLDFLVESYVSDLSGNSDVARSLRGQFTDNRPGYTVGFELEIPLENRAAIAKHEQRQWELKRSMNVFRATVEKSLTDTEVARREVATAYSEIVSRYHSMMAAEQESRYLADRFTVLPASEDSATLLLEDLLDSFERLADEESSFVLAQVDHAIALVRLKEEMGVLLKSRNARPDVEANAQNYMSTRLQATSLKTNANGPTSSIAGRTATGPSSAQSATANQNIRVVGHQLGGPPVAGYTTTWKRPKVKQASQQRVQPASSGYSQQ